MFVWFQRLQLNRQISAMQRELQRRNQRLLGAAPIPLVQRKATTWQRVTDALRRLLQ
jgi:hypothetical protein